MAPSSRASSLAPFAAFAALLVGACASTTIPPSAPDGTAPAPTASGLSATTSDTNARGAFLVERDVSATSSSATATGSAASSSAPATNGAAAERDWLPLGLGLSAVVASSVGALLLVGAHARSSRAAALSEETGTSCSRSPRPSPELCKQQGDAMVEAGGLMGSGIASLGVGVLLTGAAVAVLLSSRPDDPKPTATGMVLVPLASPTSGGLGVHGRF